MFYLKTDYLKNYIFLGNGLVVEALPAHPPASPSPAGGFVQFPKPVVASLNQPFEKSYASLKRFLIKRHALSGTKNA